MNERMRIAKLVRKVAVSDAPDFKAGMCAFDCLLQWDQGGKKLLDETIKVWEQRLKDISDGETSFTDAERNGIWVPSIPL
jgi:hypothetical protein